MSDIHKEFKPELTPKQMLELGVFGGYYFVTYDGIPDFIPKDWLKNAKLSFYKDSKLNFFKVSASQPLHVWEDKGWINKEDPNGWFEWYCKYFQGRRVEDDERQIKRWKAIRRHIAQIKKNCDAKDLTCRPRQRQALLHWAYDSRKI